MTAVAERVEVAGVAVSPDHFIGGERVASAERFGDRSPIDGSRLAEVARAREEEVDRAVRAAHEAFPAWAALGPAGRAPHLHRLAALIDKGEARFHHLAFDVTDMGGMRVALDHLGRHGRWLGWGPTRHGVGGNVASYVRIVEEPCFVELYCDMERLEPDHEPRHWPDDRFSSNTWGPLPPRSYFRFDAAAVESERESLEALGVPLPEAEGR